MSVLPDSGPGTTSGPSKRASRGKATLVAQLEPDEELQKPLPTKTKTSTQPAPVLRANLQTTSSTPTPLFEELNRLEDDDDDDEMNVFVSPRQSPEPLQKQVPQQVAKRISGDSWDMEPLLIPKRATKPPSSKSNTQPTIPSIERDRTNHMTK
ncbi:hypothetical protein H0H93_002614, partial [Arthromyces matolae]